MDIIVEGKDEVNVTKWRKGRNKEEDKEEYYNQEEEVVNGDERTE